MRHLTKEGRVEVLATIAIVSVLLGGYAIVAAIEDASASTGQQASVEWLRRDCVPKKPGDRAVATMRTDGSTSCVISENTGYGRAPRLLSAEARS